MFITDYMKDFACIGSECEDSCCAGWQVSIDKTSYKRYQKIHSPDLKALFSQHLKRTKGRQRSDDVFAVVKLDSKGACPMMDNTGLCKIHSKLGEKALSVTCRSYPRIINIIDGMAEVSAKLSCPEIARRALLNPAGIEFSEAEIDANGLSYSSRVSTSTTSSEKAGHYFWGLQLHAIELLKNRRFPLWQRLTLLGFVYRALDESHTPLSQEVVDQTIQHYKQMSEHPDYQQALEKMEFSAKVTLSMVTEFINLRTSAGVHNERYRECHEQTIDYLSADTGNEAVITANYEEAYTKYLAPFLKEHHYILENYLVNYAFQTLFPAKPQGSLFENYVSMVINYSVIRLYLVGVAGHKKEEFGIDDAIKVIQSFTKAVEHSQKFLDNVRKHFKEQGLSDMAHMSLLLMDPKTEQTAQANMRPKSVLELEPA